MDDSIKFFFSICKYAFPILFVLIVLARLTAPACGNVLKVMKELAKRKVFRGALFGFFIMLFITIGIASKNVEHETATVLATIGTSIVAGLLVGGMLLGVMSFLYDYLIKEDKTNE